jgi:hypothetical protein
MESLVLNFTKIIYTTQSATRLIPGSKATPQRVPGNTGEASAPARAAPASRGASTRRAAGRYSALAPGVAHVRREGGEA